MSNAIFLELAVAVVSGAGVGWITNAIAVSMLFRKYGRWGGVIEERYEEFIENMSGLIEEDLVNPKTLIEAFNAPAFKAVLHTWVEDILRNELPEKSGTLRFEEIPGIEQSAEQLIRLIRDLEPDATEALYRVFEYKEVQSILSKEQYEYLIEANINAVISRFKTILNVFLSSRALNTLVSQEAIAGIIENIKASIERVDFSQFDRDINAIYDELLQSIGIDRIIAELESELGRMRYADFIKDTKPFSQELISRLIEFSGSAEGQRILLETAGDVLEEAKAVRFSIADAASPALKDGIVAFINEKLPEVMNGIAHFIEESGGEIEKIVNDTIDRHLENSTDGILLKGFKDVFIGDLSKEFDVVNKIIHAVNKYGVTAKDRLTKESLSFIENGTIGNLANLLQEQNILTPQGLVTLVNINLAELPNKDHTAIEHLLHTKIGSHFKLDFAKIKTAVLPQLFDKIKREYLYQNAFKQDLQERCAAKITETANRTGGASFAADQLAALLKDQPIKTSLLNLWDRISLKKIREFISEKTIKNLRINWEALWNRHKHQELNQIYQAIQNDRIYVKITEGILSVINRHLDVIVAGNVSSLVDNELKKSNPSQIRAMVQDFIGKELKPINAFGAFLGAIAGGITVIGAFLLGVSREFTVSLLAAYGLIFAAVGIGTNWLAIKMLFRPYKKALFNVSPFIGIAALRKPEFAKNIARFIKNRTLNDESLNLFFSKNKKVLQEKSLSWLADSDYAVIDLFLGDSRRCRLITDFIFSLLQEKKYAVTLLKDALVSGKADECLPKIRDGILQKLREPDPASYLYTYLTEEIKGKNLGQYTDRLGDGLFNSAFKRLATELTPEKVKQILYRQNDRFEAYISTHSFEDFAGPNITAGLALKISEQTDAALQKAVSAILRYVKTKELNPDTKLRNLFNGKIAGFIEKHITYFLDLIVQEIRAQKGALVQQIKKAMPWYAAPAKAHVAPIVDQLIDKKLPQFLQQKKEHILTIANALLEYQLSHLGFSQEALRSEAVEQSIAGVLNAPRVRRSAARFAQAVADQYTKAPLKSTLKVLNITTIQELITVIEPLLNPAVSHIQSRLEQDGVSAHIGVKNSIAPIAGTIAVSDLLEGIDLEKELRRFITLLTQDQTVSEGLLSILSDILYDPAILQRDLDRFLTPQDWEFLRREGVPLMRIVFRRLNKAVAPETKQAVCGEYLIPAMADSGARHFKDIIGSIDIQNVVEREVNAMHPREIEKLFNKFAGTYFTKIIIYGWIGLFGGLLSYIIGCLLGIFF
ncbi:MAG: DUF445 domain-containing protein [Spirochaetaceae bacterium]|nr:DUF445 domain-containing protein [Spirochaetaceae bacterium]